MCRDAKTATWNLPYSLEAGARDGAFNETLRGLNLDDLIFFLLRVVSFELSSEKVRFSSCCAIRPIKDHLSTSTVLSFQDLNLARYPRKKIRLTIVMVMKIRQPNPSSHNWLTINIILTSSHGICLPNEWG